MDAGRFYCCCNFLSSYYTIQVLCFFWSQFWWTLCVQSISTYYLFFKSKSVKKRSETFDSLMYLWMKKIIMQILSLKNLGTNYNITDNPFLFVCLFFSCKNLNYSIHFKRYNYEYSKKILHKLEASWLFKSILQYLKLCAYFKQLVIFQKWENLNTVYDQYQHLSFWC